MLSAQLFALCVACSSETPAPQATDAGGGSAGTGSGGTGGGTGGAGGSGGSGGADSGSGGDALVGTFQVRIVPNDQGSGTTSVLGKVYDGPTPAAINWIPGTKSGACVLLTPKVPFCDPACGSDVCVGSGVCQAYPTGKSVGTVSVTGLKTGAGAGALELLEVAKAYQLPGGTTLSYPPFAEGDAIRVTTSGGDYAPFTLEARGIAVLEVTSSSLVVETGKPLALAWKAASMPAATEIHVKLDISHHGGSKGMIECDAPDSGSLEIPASMITELVSLGVAGFPTIVIARESIGSRTITPGRVELVITSDVEMAVTVPGVRSCTADTDCGAGQTCQADLTCR